MTAVDKSDGRYFSNMIRTLRSAKHRLETRCRVAPLHPSLYKMPKGQDTDIVYKCGRNPGFFYRSFR